MADTESKVEIEVMTSLRTNDTHLALCRAKEDGTFFITTAGPTGGTTIFADPEEIRKFARGMLKALASLN
ncbi:MAG: hypothetical protein J0I99_00465 [Devosia sp.]|uniref:hypothetical protein n=1 Tax=Devosia sp. TaxID=1871048 RepID=UPI001ACEA6A0|nr:hypothetical protein [Devosia sp.]MBN9310836.1 hypothetical protein [Devosia sp.]MBN9314189.1 hypothetical protein [Devosia sp.]